MLVPRNLPLRRGRRHLQWRHSPWLASLIYALREPELERLQLCDRVTNDLSSVVCAVAAPKPDISRGRWSRFGRASHGVPRWRGFDAASLTEQWGIVAADGPGQRRARRSFGVRSSARGDQVFPLRMPFHRHETANRRKYVVDDEDVARCIPCILAVANSSSGPRLCPARPGGWPRSGGRHENDRNDRCRLLQCGDRASRVDNYIDP
jgi:hypothetical protein